MKLVKNGEAGILYDKMIRGGGIATYEGLPWLQQGGFNFGLLLRPFMGIVRNLLGVVPKIAKRGLKEIGPNLALAGLSAGADAIMNKKSIGTSMKDALHKEKTKIFEKGKNIVKEEGLKALMKGRGKRKKMSKAKSKKKTKRKKKTIFD